MSDEKILLRLTGLYAMLAARRDRGIARLTEKLGERWPGGIDPSRLDLASPETCIVGQLHRAGRLGDIGQWWCPDSYHKGLDKLGLAEADGIALGFALETGTGAYEDRMSRYKAWDTLTLVWQDYLAGWRAQHPEEG